MAMAHVFHADLPGYDERQLFYDGCPECERRCKDPNEAVLYLDHERFRRAWDRTINWQRDDQGHALGLSRCECRVLQLLWTLYLLVERGHLTPAMVMMAGPRVLGARS